MKMVYVGGAHGVGKTTVLNEIEKNGALEGGDCRIVHASRLISGIAQQEYGRDWKSLNAQEQEAVRKQVTKCILSLQEGLVIVDSHYVEMVGSSAKVIIPDEFKGIIESYIVVEAAQEAVLSRRVNDKTKERPTDAGLIRLEIDAEKSAAKKLADEASKELHVISNDDPKSAAEAILALLRRQMQVKP